MKLSHELGKIFEEEFQKVLEKEVNDPKYLSQDDFENCMDRAKAGVAEALPKVEKFLATAIAAHRIEKHGEPLEEELKTYSEGLTEQEVAISTQGWWGG